MKRLVLLAGLAGLIFPLVARSLSQTEIITAAKNWFGYEQSRLSGGGSGAGQPSVEAIQPQGISDGGKSDLYLVSFVPQGFALVSGDDRLKPVLGFSLTGSADTATVNDGFNCLIANYTEQIKSIKNDTRAVRHPEWDTILSNEFPPSTRDERDISPMTTTTWNHTWPYNAMCPESNACTGGHVPAGCLAGAMSQILKFWAYPLHGTGANAYNMNPWGMLYVNFAEATYNYDSMPNALTTVPDDDISQLMYHVGVAATMLYSPSGSGTTPSLVRSALIEHFNYADEAELRYFFNTGQAAWEEDLRYELQLGRIIMQFGTNYYSGQSHAWLVDGFMQTNYFHINWGWGGTYDGYYYMSNLNPGTHLYNQNLGGLFRIHPLPTYPLTVPENLTASVVNGSSVQLNWTPMSATGLRGFSIYRNNTKINTVFAAMAATYLDSNPTPGIYTYKIVAEYTLGTSDYSNSQSVIVHPAPAQDYTNGFESFTSFGVPPFPWLSLDNDHAATQSMSGYNFTNEGQPAAFITFVPLQTIPPNYDLTAHTGLKTGACFGAVGTANNDWLICPLWQTGNIAQFRFWARSETGGHSLSRLKVGVTTNQQDISNLTIISGANAVTVPSTWTEYTYALTGYQNQNILAGIQCVSEDGYILLVDDIRLSTNVGTDDNTTQVVNTPQMHFYPNPFSTFTEISIELKEPAHVELTVFDIKGRRLRTLYAGYLTAGAHSYIWNSKKESGKQLASGIYLVKLRAGKEEVIRKVVFKGV